MSRSSELTYTPAWWVPGAHFQTLWARMFRRPPVVETRSERWPTPDGDEIEIHRIDAADGATDAPRLLILHGLEGTVRSHYLVGMLSLARAHGWAADALIFRGCNGEVNRAPRMYHSGETSDLDFVVRRLVRENPDQALTLAGFSLGGNVLLKWLGEQGNDAPEQVRAAATVSVPYDLERGSRNIERGFSRLYTRHFLRSLQRKAAAKLVHFPGLFDSEAMLQASTLFDFDHAVTAPMHGFAGALDYYTRSSSIRFLSQIRLRTLLLSSYDDPFLPPDVLDSVRLLALENPCLQEEFYHRGGHVGFVSGRNPFSARYFAEERVFEFLTVAVRRPSAHVVR